MEHKLHPHPPRPWDYNPSSWSQRVRIALIALVAAFIALYLGLYQWRVIPTIWDPLFGDGTKNVLDSDVSHQITSWIRIPDAILGVFAYLSDAIFALAGSERRWQDRPWLVILFGIDVIPLGAVSIILVILQGIAVKFWCFLCLVTAAISLTLILLAYDEIISSCIYLYEVKKRSNWKTLWWAFWGYPSPEALEAGEATLQIRKKGNVSINPIPKASVGGFCGMWARIGELTLGAWLIVSHFIFSVEDWNDLGAAFLIILFAAISYIDKLNKTHLLQIIPIGWLFYLSYSYPTPWLPFYMQNYILTALSLLMFAIIPSRASEHPRPWKRFLDQR